MKYVSRVVAGGLLVVQSAGVLAASSAASIEIDRHGRSQIAIAVMVAITIAAILLGRRIWSDKD